MGGSFREVWIPRIFIASLAPAIVMLVALIFYPTSELAKCPLLVPKMTTSRQNHHLPVEETDLSITIQGHIFSVHKSVVLEQPIDPLNGTRLVFLGIVLDVTSGVGFYGSSDGPYRNLTRDGVDTTRALLMSSLNEENLNGDLTDFDPNVLRDRLLQWLPFFLNKYPQVGVVEGRFFSKSGQPTKQWLEIVDLLATAPQAPESPFPFTEECIRSGDSVSCTSENHRPKIIRHRGTSRCACGVEEELFASKSPLFAVVHFDNCNEESTVCWPKIYEL